MKFIYDSRRAGNQLLKSHNPQAFAVKLRFLAGTRLAAKYPRISAASSPTPGGL
jgi:hypothetical protein